MKMKIRINSVLFISLFTFCMNPVFGHENASEFTKISINSSDDFYKPNFYDPLPGQKIFYQRFEVPIEKVEPFLAFSIVWNSVEWNENQGKFFAVFSKEDGSDPKVLEIKEDSHDKKEAGRHTSELMFIDKEYKFLDFTFATPSKTAEFFDLLELHFYSPGKSLDSEIQENAEDRSTCQCPQPSFQSRSDWCPNGNCPPNPNPENTTATHLIVHHTATSNTASDWAAVVRSIWNFHVNTNNWSDIGYNWLVDPNGVIYEGRGDGILGAHFCGTNTNTMGTAVIGNFQEDEPTNSAIENLTSLLAWKVCDNDLDPIASAFHGASGQNLFHISGHRDGCSTACPGDLFYPQFPNLRTNVQAQIDNGCTATLSSPTNLEGTAVTPSQINLVWDDNSNDEEQFVLERSKTFNDNYQVIAELPANTTSYEDIGVSSNSIYIYKVKAINMDGESFYSNEEVVLVGTTDVSNEFLNENTVQIFPNPVVDDLNVSIENAWKGTTSISILGIDAKMVYLERTFEKHSDFASFNLETNGLVSGMYLLKIVQGEYVGIFKLVKD